MLLGEFFGGISIYLYQIYFFQPKKNRSAKYFGINLIKEQKKIDHPNIDLKIIILIFFCIFF